MPILNIPQALVDDLLAIARNAQEVAIPHEIIRNSIISAVDCLRALEALANPQAILAELGEEDTIQQGVIAELRVCLDVTDRGKARRDEDKARRLQTGPCDLGYTQREGEGEGLY